MSGAPRILSRGQGPMRLEWRADPMQAPWTWGPRQWVGISMEAGLAACPGGKYNCPSGLLLDFMSPRAADKGPSRDLKHWWSTAQIIVALPRPKPLPLALPGSPEWKRSPQVRSAAGTATSPQAGQWPRRPRVCRSAERRRSFLSRQRPLQRKRQLGLFQGQDPKPSS